MWALERDAQLRWELDQLREKLHTYQRYAARFRGVIFYRQRWVTGLGAGR